MMTTLQLGQRLMFFFEGIETLGEFPIQEKGRLVDAINLGLGEFLSLLPDSRLGSLGSWLLRAPIVQSINIVSGATGFSYQAGTPYPEGGYLTENDALGHAAVVAGDGQLNRLARSGELLSPYAGATGIVDMTLYGDAANLAQTDQRLLSGVELVEVSGARHPLTYHEGNHVFTLAQSVQTGLPQYYYLSPHRGHETTSSPLWHLRVWPLPIAQCTLQASIRSFPASLTFDDLFVARNLPLTVEEESLLIAMISPGLRLSKMLASHLSKTDRLDEAERAKRRLRTMHEPRQGEITIMRTREGF